MHSLGTSISGLYLEAEHTLEVPCNRYAEGNLMT